MVSLLLASLVFSLVVVSLADYIPVPGGYAWDECVHFVSSNSHIYQNDLNHTIIVSPDGTKQILPPCIHPRKLSLSKHINPKASVDADGWQSWASYNTADNSTFTNFLGNFSVPAAPVSFNHLGIIYLFIGVQNDNWIPTPSVPTPTPPGFDIIQPVLQYGSTPAGGGDYWAIASWYVTLDNSFVVSTLVKVMPGDVISGSITKKSEDTWFVGAAVVGTSQSSNINITRPRLVSQPWAYCTLEVYNIDECRFLPSSTSVQFTNLYLETAEGQITPHWDTFTGPKNNPCNTKAIAQSSDVVEIAFP